MFDDNNLYGTAVGLRERGRHKTLVSALDAAFRDLTTERNDFFDSLCDTWEKLFPGLPARPGKYADGKIFVFVKNAATSYVIRPKLRKIAAKLATLPGAPKRVDLRLEIHAS